MKNNLRIITCKRWIRNPIINGSLLGITPTHRHLEFMFPLKTKLHTSATFRLVLEHNLSRPIRVTTVSLLSAEGDIPKKR